MRSPCILVIATALLASPAAGELPVPSQSAVARDAEAYLFHAGAGDVFEISSSMLAVKQSQNPQVRAFAAMLIGDHTTLSNTTLAIAKGADVMPPPPVLSTAQTDMITRLTNAGAAFDRVYMQQQVAAHQNALKLQQSYAANGDTPALRQSAASAVPIIQGHLVQAQQLLGSIR